MRHVPMMRLLRSRHRATEAALFAAALLCLAGCAVGCTAGPRYVRPTIDVPTQYKEMGPWKTAEPSDAIQKGKWWEIYQDPELNALEEQIDVSNLTLKAAEDQFLQARAAVRISRSAQYPTVTGGLSVSPARVSANRPLANKTSGTYNTDLVIPVDVSYEADVWGRVRRTVEASRAEAQASAADVASVGLSLHAELALDYFQLRGLDAQLDLLNSTIAAFEKALELTQNRHNAGLSSALDVTQAQTQLETTRAQAQDLGVARAAFEHAIAVLIGKAPSGMSLPLVPLKIPPPAIPAGLPSDLLERRPDIASSERRVQEANARIGVARAAYYPLVTLTGAAGLESTAIGTLVQGPSILWSLGASAAQILFDAGRRHAISEQAWAAYDQSVASYRQTVLNALEDVEDNLAALRVLEGEAKTQALAVDAAEHSLSLSTTLYKGGLTNYLQVITAQSTALTNERTAVDLLTRRMQASVLLVKAIGGGWMVSQIPKM
jgi:NodT family efflux transporter outer membrane factor (OMF) lipoprotein